jgi:hypothetical protein
VAIVKFPETPEQAEQQGYKFTGTSHCRGCGVVIEWYETPNGKRIPINGGEQFDPHWASCPRAQDFRRNENGKS